MTKEARVQCIMVGALHEAILVTDKYNGAK